MLKGIHSGSDAHSCFFVAQTANKFVFAVLQFAMQMKTKNAEQKVIYSSCCSARAS